MKQVRTELQEEQQEKQKDDTNQVNNMIDAGTLPFCEANLDFVHNELVYFLHPRMHVGETVYIENAP